MNTLVKNALLAPFNVVNKISPRLSLELLFRLKQGYRLNLERPKTFSEKIQWIKLYDHNPLMPICADKYTVREYVEKCGYGSYLNELYWHGSNPEEIPFDQLPCRYVVKVTHGSTFNVLVDGSKSPTPKEIVSKCQRWLKAKFLPCYGEWFYGKSGGVEPSVVIERFIDSKGKPSLDDYKIFVMNGRAVLILVCTERTGSSHFEDYFDRDWTPLKGVDMGEKPSGKQIERPACLNEMLRAAERLASPFTHARVDFYVVNNRPIFGEITFTSGSGFDRFHPYDFDEWLGSTLELPRETM